MKNNKEILQTLATDLISENSKITYLGQDGVVRAILNAVANTTFESWADLYQIKRQMFVETSSGGDLDNIASRNNITRRSATKSSVVLIINGPDSTVIPAGTLVKSSVSGVIYQTKSEITLGERNPDISRPVLNSSLGDVVIAESITTGSNSKVSAGELSQFVTQIDGVTVTNLVGSTGGLDEETDVQLRSRIINQVSLLNQGTKVFYETLAKENDSSIIKAKAEFDPTNLGTKIYLVKNSFASYTQGELDTIAAAIYEKQRALSSVNCYNASIQSIEVQFSYTRVTGYNHTDIVESITENIAALIENEFEFGAVIKYQDILNIIIDEPGVDLTVGSFYLNGKQENISCGSNSVPRFTTITASDGTTGTIISIEQQIITV